MRPRNAPSLLLAALMLLATLGAPACRRPATDEDTAAETAPEVVLAVSAARVAVKPMRQEIALPGITAALRTLTLRAPASGRVEGLEVTTGDRVQSRRGDRSYHQSRGRRGGGRRRGRANRSIPTRLPRWRARSSVTPAARASRCACPITPSSLQRVVSPGQIVNEFDPLVELVDPSSVYVDAQAPINQLGALKAGMDASVVSSLKAGVVYPARVWSISPSFSAGGTTAPVWVQFTGPDRISEIGASVEVHVTTKSVPDAIVIPAARAVPGRRAQQFLCLHGGRRRPRPSHHRGHRNSHPKRGAGDPGAQARRTRDHLGRLRLSDGLHVRASVTP